MTNSKSSSAPKAATNKAAPATGANRQGQAQGASASPQQTRRPGTIDETIAKAQSGRVNVTPAKAIEMAGQLYSRGQYGQAERVCRQIIASRPGNADAHNILGVSLAALGQKEEAVASLKRAIKISGQAASYHANLGEILRQAGRLDEAAAAIEEAIKLEPNNAQALNNLGIIQYERKQFADAVQSYRRALELRPTMAEALNNLGNALRLTGDIDGALHAYQEALTQRAVYPEVYNNLGTLLQQDQKFEEAEHALRKAIQQNPNYIEAHNNLAQLLSSQKQEVEALRVLGEALKFAPKNVQTLLLTAKIQLRRSNLQAAEQATRLALQEEAENAEALTVLGQVLHETDRYDEALEVLDRALKKAPDNPEALNFYGVALKSVGRLDEAREHILKALKLNDSMYGAYANLNDLVDFSKGIGEELFNRMEAIFESIPNQEAEPFLALHFAYAKALDDRGQHEKALDHYITGGRMKRAQLDYKESETHGFFDSIRATFPKEAFENRKFAGLDDDRPVFIVGMPRSGSTLVEQILSSHPDIYGAGEVKYLSRALGQLRDRFPSLPKYPEMAQKITPAQLDIVAKNYQQALAQGAGDAKKITDKLLTNYFFLGLINLLFPKAKVIHTRRDPVDTCLSGFTKLFKDDMPHSYDLSELGRYYAKYRELMEHWEKVLPEGFMTTVVYEDVVADTEKEARRLIEFLGLPWNEKCVDFHKSDRPVKTASVAQVRKPIYKTSVQRWKKYGAGLQPLVDAVGGKPEKGGSKAKAKVKENA
ncbi:MAG TPA: tetratricopeptide repeat protein [Sphingomicrobium sp.]|nr:tetratricopeptide repeat protein [Sphingomicrobium sp.]